MAGIVFSVGEEQDEISAGRVIDLIELVEARLVDSIENGRSTDTAFSVRGELVNARGQRDRVAGPGLCDLRQEAEIHDKGLVGLLP